MKHMIFEPIISGHVLEWLNHIYNYVAVQEEEYVFVLPLSFKHEKKRLAWAKASNISVVYLSDEESKICSNKNLLKSAFATSRLISQYAKKLSVDKVFLIFLMKTMPFLTFLLPTNVSVSGVLYRIYLYDEKKRGARLLLEKIRYWIIAKSKKVESVFVLNDTSGACRLNECYKTSKFVYLPDPLPNMKGPFRNVRQELKIPSDNKVFLQFGTIDSRKNSLTILNACLRMSDDEQKNKTVIFSGRIDAKIRSEFFSLVEKLNGKMQIIVEEGFLSYERLNDFCYSSDYLLVLYENVCQSSGTIGYGAFFGKPVLGPSKGLLGDLIKKYSLGIVLDDINPENVKTAMCTSCSPKKNDYCKSHTIESFCKVLLR
jgi:glycosyltransferase involved in cell wall biosynthesis